MLAQEELAAVLVATAGEIFGEPNTGEDVTSLSCSKRLGAVNTGSSSDAYPKAIWSYPGMRINFWRYPLVINGRIEVR